MRGKKIPSVSPLTGGRHVGGSAAPSGSATRAGGARSGERESAETGLNPAAGCAECASNVRRDGSPPAAPRGVQGHSDRFIHCPAVVLNSAGAKRP